MFQILIFLPALALDIQRIRDKRMDVLCCIKKEDASEPREDIVRKYFNKYFVPFVMKKSTKFLTIVITICLIVIGIFSTKKLLRGLN
jgi:uncharacterized membrane protein YhaH (DUF805 family)